MVPTNATKLEMLAIQNRMLKEENAAMRDRIRELKGQLSEAQRQQNAEDEMVFQIVRRQAPDSKCQRTVIVIEK